MTRKHRLVVAAILVGLAWRFGGRDGIELLSWLAGTVAAVLAWEAADVVRGRQPGPGKPASTADRSSGDDVPDPVAPSGDGVPGPAVLAGPVDPSAVAGPRPDQASRARNAAGAVVGLLSLVAVVALFTWIATYDGPRGTQEVTCAVGFCFAT